MTEQPSVFPPIRQVDAERAGGLVLALNQESYVDFLQTFGAMMSDQYGDETGVFSTLNTVHILAGWVNRIETLREEIAEGQAMDTLRAVLDEIGADSTDQIPEHGPGPVAENKHHFTATEWQALVRKNERRAQQSMKVIRGLRRDLVAYVDSSNRDPKKLEALIRRATDHIAPPTKDHA